MRSLTRQLVVVEEDGHQTLSVAETLRLCTRGFTTELPLPDLLVAETMRS